MNIYKDILVFDNTYREIIKDSDEEQVIIHNIINHINDLKAKPTQNQWNDIWSSTTNIPEWFNNQQRIYRFNNGFITTQNNFLEKDIVDYLRTYIYRKYLHKNTWLIEFGCGSGHNLDHFVDLGYSKFNIYGSDFARSALQKLESRGIASFYFDMYNSEYEELPEVLKFYPKDCIVFTCGAMEQLGNQFGHFYNLLLKMNAGLYIHIEPLIELYDQDNTLDKLAIQYHHKRQYLNGFLDRLQISNRINILECTRTTFGTLYNEGYNILIWQQT